MCAFKAGSVYGEVILDDSKWQAGVKGVDSSNKGMVKSFAVAQLAVDAFKKVVSASINVTKQAIKNAIDFNETQNKFKTVFGDGNKAIKAATDSVKNLTKNYGLSKKAATELLSSTGDLLTGLGFQKDQAIELSNSVQELAVDLASFQNIEGGAARASEALTKAILGETEMAKSLGIVIQQGTKEFNAQVKALMETEGLTKLQARAQLILNQAYEQSKNAVGDFQRTQFETANMQRQLIEQNKDISAQFGQAFVPIVHEMTASMLDGAKAMNTFLQDEKNLAVISQSLMGIWEGIKSIGEGFKSILTELAGEANVADTAFQPLAIIMKSLSSALLIVGKAIAVQLEFWAEFINVAKNAGQVVGTVIEVITRKKTWEEGFAEIKDITKDTFNSIVERAQNFGEDFVSDLTDIWKKTDESTEKELNEFVKTVGDKTNEVNDLLKNVGSGDPVLEKWAERQKEVLDEWAGLRKKSLKEQTSDIKSQAETYKQYGADEVEVNRWANKEIRKAWASQASSTLNTVASIGSQISSIYSNVFDTVMGFQQQELDQMKYAHEQEYIEMQEQTDRALTAVDERYNAEIEKLQWKVEVGTLTQEEANEQISVLEQEREDEKNRIQEESNKKLEDKKKKNREKENAKEKQIFEANKANQIAMVWIQAAIGIVGAWAQSISQLGPIAGSIFAGILTAAILGVAIAQTVLISQQQFIPAKRVGGMASGTTRVNEEGGEIITLPDGSQVIPNDISQQIAGNSGGGKSLIVNNNFRGAIISSDLDINNLADKVSSRIARQWELA